MFALIAAMSISMTPIDWSMLHHDKARSIVLGADMLIGCLKDGIGQKMNGKSFWAGCGMGVTTGTMDFIGKSMIASSPAVAVPGKFMIDFGLSMQDNIMRGADPLSRFQTDIGPFGLTFDKPLPTLSISILTVSAIISSVVRHDKLQLTESLQYLTPIFSANKIEHTTAGEVDGYASGSMIWYSTNAYIRAISQKHILISHEMVHVAQYREAKACNSLISLTEYISLGQDLCLITFSAAGYFRATYWYDPFEFETYAMQR